MSSTSASHAPAAASNEAPIATVDVVIVGAGPVGLMLANLLGLYGRSALVVEERPALIDFPRAVGMDDEAMRLIQTIGLADDIVPLTGPAHIMRLVNARGQVLLFNDPQQEDFGWSRKNGFNQPDVDAELLKGLGRFDRVDCLFDHMVRAVDEDDDGVTVHVLAGDPAGQRAERRIRARFVVGCDGGRSGTRKRMGVSFDGLSPSTRWLVIDLERDPLGTPNVWLGADASRPYVSIGLPHGVRRFEFRLRDDEPDEIVTQPEFVARLLRGHVPDPTAVRIIRSRVYTHHGRVASSFRVGRQLIAGDAAHLMPVWLGQGWNSGVRDAMNLGWKLAMVVAGQASEDLLDTYTLERQGHATAMVRLSMLMGRLIKMGNPVGVLVRDSVFRVANRFPSFRTYVGELRFRPMPRYERGVVVDQATMTPGRAQARVTGRSVPVIQAVDNTTVVGRLFPQPQVSCAGLGRVLLDDALGPWWSMLSWVNDPADLLGEAGRRQVDALGARLIRVVPENQRSWAEAHSSPGVVVVGDVTGRLKKWFDVRPVGAVLLRPDRFVAAACLAQQAPEALEAVLLAASWRGTSTAPMSGARAQEGVTQP